MKPAFLFQNRILHLLIIVTILYHPPLCSKESTLPLVLQLCLWDEPEATVLQRIREARGTITPLSPEKYGEYSNEILQYLLHINKEESTEEIRLYIAQKKSPAIDFLFYRQRLCCISLVQKGSTLQQYQKLYMELKETFGPPETGRTEDGSTHTFKKEGTTAQMTTEGETDGAITIRLHLFPSNLFSRLF